ncbi:hypothetical protein KW797_02280 [Candidatus Parcubacteria bacterium]|nr:hypothetical protein [Candidatus Parcubacteria bacterium]
MPRPRTSSLVSLRSLADSITKVTARLPAPSDEFDSSEAKAILNEAAGVLMELANRFRGSELAAYVELQVQAQGDRSPQGPQG